MEYKGRPRMGMCHMKGGNLSCGNELPLIYHNIYLKFVVDIVCVLCYDGYTPQGSVCERLMLVT